MKKKETMSTSTPEATASSQRPPHKNPIAKVAHGYHDWAMLAIVENLDPKEALETIENLILKEAESRQWRKITLTRMEYDKSHRHYGGLHFDYWQIGASDRATEATKHELTFQLIRLMSKIINTIDYQEIVDEDMFSIMLDTLVNMIGVCDPGPETAIVWRDFLTLAHKTRKSGWKPLLSKEIIMKSLDRYFSVRLNPAKTLWYIRETGLSGTPLGHNSLGLDIIQWLWDRLGKDAQGKQIEWAEIISPLVVLPGKIVSITVGTSEVVTFCKNAITRVCTFAQTIDTLPEFVRKLELPFGEIKIVYDLEKCWIKEIIVSLNTGHVVFFEKEIEQQKEVVEEAKEKLLAKLVEWSKEHTMENFLVTIIGELAPPDKANKPPAKIPIKDQVSIAHYY